MKTSEPRTIVDFQVAAEQQLRQTYNLYAILNTVTFIKWWGWGVFYLFVASRFPTWNPWWLRLAVMLIVIKQTYVYPLYLTQYIPNVRQMRRLADEARRNFTRGELVPERLSWCEIFFTTGAIIRWPVFSLHDPNVNWGLTHREVLMAYIHRLPLQVEELRRLRRATWREQARQAKPPTLLVPPKPSTPPVAAIEPPRPCPERTLRPLASKHRLEPRAKARPLTIAVAPTRLPSVDRVIADFSLQSLLPSELDVEHSETLLVWGLVRPGRRGGAYVGNRTAEYEQLHHVTRQKLQADFENEQFQAILEWLVKHGVVNRILKRRHYGYSLNMTNGHESPSGQPVREAVSRFLHQVRTTSRA